MRERHLAGSRHRPAADHPDVADRVVRRAERPQPGPRRVRHVHARGGMHREDLEELGLVGRGQDGGDTLRDERLPRAGWSDE